MTIQVKICGITSASAIDAAAGAGAVYGGLVFHPTSPRFVAPDQARALAQHMRGRLRCVALITDMNDTGIAELMKAVAPDFLQLHGGETVQRTADIRARFGVAVIKALPVAEASDLAGAAEYEKVADMLMFDATPRRAPTGPAVMAQPSTGKFFPAALFASRGFSPAGLIRTMSRAPSHCRAPDRWTYLRAWKARLG